MTRPIDGFEIRISAGHDDNSNVQFITLAICQTIQKLPSAFFCQTYVDQGEMNTYNDLYDRLFYILHLEFYLPAASPALYKDHRPHHSKQVLAAACAMQVSLENLIQPVKEERIPSMYELSTYLKESLSMWS
jgi:hypothetical protein